MRIAVVGTGAVGGYFGGLLATGSHEVIFIARGDILRAMLAAGLYIRSVLGDFTIEQPQATDDAHGVGAVDVVLLTVKSWQIPDAVDALRPLVSAETIIVPLQNGVDSPRELAKFFDSHNVLGGMCKIGSRVAAPGEIEHFAIDPYLAFGHLDGAPSPLTGELRTALREVGVTAEIPSDIRLPMWEKFLLIAPWSGLGAVTRAPIGVLREIPQTRAMLVAAMQEVAAVGRAAGVPLAADVVSSTMSFVDTITPGATASMQRDIQAGKRSELMTQTAAVVRHGAAAGCKTPVNEFLFHSLLPLELKALGELDFDSS